MSEKYLDELQLKVSGVQLLELFRSTTNCLTFDAVTNVIRCSLSTSTIVRLSMTLRQLPRFASASPKQFDPGSIKIGSRLCNLHSSSSVPRMNAPHICRACHRKLLAQIRWPPTATFISLSNARTTTDDGEATDRSSDGDAKKRNGTAPVSSSPYSRDQSQKRGSRRSGIDHGDLLESFFAESVQSPYPGKPAQQRKANGPRLEDYENLERLTSMIADPKAQPGELWKFFIDHFSPSKGRTGTQLTSFSLVMRRLFHRLTRERTRTSNAPTVAQISWIYANLGLLRPKDLKVLIDGLLSELSASKTSSTESKHQGVAGAGISSSLDNIVVDDLLGTWRVLLLSNGATPKTSGSGKPGDHKDWSWFPEPERRRGSEASRVGGIVGLERAFQALMPHLQNAHLKGITSAGLLTYALLMEHVKSIGAEGIEGHPFMIFIAQSLVRTHSTPHDLKTFVHGEYPHLDADNDWVSILRVAGQNVAASVDHAKKGLGHEPVGDGLHVMNLRGEPRSMRSTLKDRSASVHRQLSRALARRDLHAVNELWRESTSTTVPENVQATLDGTSRSVFGRGPQNILSQDVCNHFILVYMGLRQPNRAIDIWNFMIENSIPPALSTWTSMLEGCKTARSLTALEGIWSKLISSGMNPDVICWTTRIGGLIECGRPDLAIKALEEMGRLWIQAAKLKKVSNLQGAGDIDGVIKPTIVTINAAVVGLLRRGQQESVNRLLAWGGQLGIKPDVITFNTLLRPLVRGGQTEEVRRLLQLMQEQGVEADVATFTTIIEETFRAGQTLSPAQQSEAVDSIFAEMETAGIHANLKTYGKIIHSLLQSSSDDISAVQAVLSRMTSQGLKPSTYIYTMLVGHYFRQDPPDLEAIRTFIERVRVSGATNDHIFWDRVIEGYARLKDTAAALTILGREDKEGRRVGWYALETVLRALVENDEWDLASQVVGNVRIDRGPPLPAHVKGIEGQHSFWRAVSELGLEEA
ncbi:MAG: hypothetical protein M1818_005710 [Claussenomyces sp. TS43310]|nr:MAG: hypothetical protein M1818_005710 [Claussenomyces sp. TS43310]